MEGMAIETGKPLVTLTALLETDSYGCFTVHWPYSTSELCIANNKEYGPYHNQPKWKLRHPHQR